MLNKLNKKTIKKKIQKEISNNYLTKKIDFLLKNSEKTDKRIEAVSTNISKQTKEVDADLSKRIKEVDINLSKQIRSTNERIEIVSEVLSGKIQEVPKKVEVVVFVVANVRNRLDEIDIKILGVNQKLNGINGRFDDLTINFAKIDKVN